MKLIIVINGKGGAGKDTLCAALSEKYRVVNVSSIDPIKEIARSYGWNGEKDMRSRRFLAELKEAFINYCDLPKKYLCEKANEFLAGDGEVMFVHIREPKEIAAFRDAIYPARCLTLLVRRAGLHTGEKYGNAADDEVENFSYDLVFDNDMPLEESKAAFLRFFSDCVLKNEAVSGGNEK